MIDNIKLTTQRALDALDHSSMSLIKKDLIRQMTQDIQQLMDKGDWDVAVKLSSYRHEFAKTAKNLDWYSSYLEIRKVRDKLKILIGK